MAPVTRFLGDALDQLNDQIAQAEELLSRTPGADVLRSIECKELQDEESQTFLEWESKSRQGSRLRCVRTSPDGAGLSDIAVTSLAITDRIAVAKYIPEFIRLSIDANTEVIERVDEATAAIEQAIAAVKKKK